jgi:uncharacterized protein (TIGR02246 family)
MKRCFLVVALAALFGCSSSTQMTRPGDAERAINQANRDFSEAVRRGDADALAALYADTAALLPPNMATFRGRDAIRQAWSGLLSQGKAEVTLTTDSVVQSCDMASEVGHYDLTMTSNAAGAAPVHDSGKYVVTWQNINGKWRIVSDIWNSSMPPTAPR